MAGFTETARNVRTFGSLDAPKVEIPDMPDNLAGLAVMASAPEVGPEEGPGMVPPMVPPAPIPTAPIPRENVQPAGIPTGGFTGSVKVFEGRQAPSKEFVPHGGEASNTPSFLVCEIKDNDIFSFSKEYNPSIEVVHCVADKQMLLQYMVATERRYNLTLSFPAYGVDPIVFDEMVAESAAKVKMEEDMSGNPIQEMPPVVSIEMNSSVQEGGSSADLYEKILVDDVLYLSCLSRCLNKDYLHSVIAEATEAVYMHGQYIYTLVGPRPLTIEGEAQGTFIETLKLNSYELSVLMSYMRQIDGVTIKHGLYDGHSAISFSR